MFIVCTSDSHGKIIELEKIKNNHPNADLFLDAGDSERYEFEIVPYLSVKGNCDYFIDTPYRIIEVEDIRIYLFHGDGCLLSNKALIKHAKQNNCDIIIHGHTHRPYIFYQDGVHIICPGSVSLPRTKEGCTYALITITKDAIEAEILKVNKNEKY